MSDEIEDIIQRTSDFKGHGIRMDFNGCYLAERYKLFAKDIEELDVEDSDIWVTSFPKGGTTWTQEMVYLIMNDCDYEKAKIPIAKRFPFLELSTLYDFSVDVKLEKTEDDRYREDTIRFIKEDYKHSPRFIKTHLPWYLLPASIQKKEKRPKIIHVARNPKDVCTSYYFHYLRGHGFNGNLEEFCKLFLADKVMFAPFWTNILSYWQQKHEPNVLFITYEDMKRDLRSVVEKVANFLDKSVPNDKMDQLLKHLDFSSMKTNPAVNYEHRRKEGDHPHMRKGVIGDFKNHMSDEIVKKFDEWITKNDTDRIFKF